GVILYQLLTGRLPFSAPNRAALHRLILEEQPVPPSQFRPGLPARLDEICLRALAKRVEDRPPGMQAPPAELAAFLAASRPAPGGPQAAAPPLPPALPSRIAPGNVRFLFAGFGERAPAATGPADRLYLDVGNDLRPGVIDHHQRSAFQGSTTSLVL